MSSVTPLVVTHPHALVRDGLQKILSKSSFRPTHILPALDETAENLLASAGACIWLVGVTECGTATNELVSKMVAKNPEVRAVILTASHTASDVLPAFVAGAYGFLRQDIPSKQLIKSLELVALGESVMHPHFRQMGLISPAGPAPALGEGDASPETNVGLFPRRPDTRSSNGLQAAEQPGRRGQEPVAPRIGDLADADRRRVEQDYRAQDGDYRVDGEGAYEGYFAEAQTAESDTGCDLGANASR